MTQTDHYERIRFPGTPSAHPDAVVTDGDVRFTVLTPRLIRLEWSESGEFEDRSTYAFPTRYVATPPAFHTSVTDAELQIDTGSLRLRYATGSGAFSASNLSIAYHVTDEERVWHPGMPSAANLRGTRRTLDWCAGDASLEEGLLSRDGWSLFDDSQRVVFDDTGWVGARPGFELQDWYFFGYGHDYVEALQDYAVFGGEVPLIPRFVLGAWWSRYWAYSEKDLRDLVAQFESHGVPLDVLVIDMDWHTPHAWTGYTWNRDLFPDPPAFLRWVHDKGLKVTLNLHPAQGVQSFEEIYEDFATAVGIDPKTGEPVPFRIADKAYVRHYFEMLHHPMEDDGVDFWWMDWQQGEISEVKGLDPLPWINHLHFSDNRRRGVRPMLYSRWGGLGNHRYFIGFSGDTYTTWEALQFQPFMTATASNVLYGWWSHDIGGHMGGATEPELYARWVQFGALSPVLRLHSTKDPRAERRPWAYPEPVYQAAKAAFKWRYRLLPYLYTMARVTTDTSISLCRPMYYEHPETDAAYVARYQYYLGNQMIAAPIVFAADSETGMASTDVWLPPGTWIAYDTFETFVGPRWVRVLGDLHRMPMFVRSGGILPLSPDPEVPVAELLASGNTQTVPRDHLILELFPGEGEFRVYADDGETEAYRDGDYEWLPVRTRQNDGGRAWVAELGPVEGRCSALPETSSYEVRLKGSRRPVQVTIDGELAQWTYNDTGLTTVIAVPRVSKTSRVVITAASEEEIVALGATRNREVVERDLVRLLGAAGSDVKDATQALGWEAGGRPAPIVQDAVARLGGPFYRVIEFTSLDEASGRLGSIVLAAPSDDSSMDVQVDFTLNCEGEVAHCTVSRTGVTKSLVVDVPFGFDGTLRGLQWHAAVTMSWAGHTLTGTYSSAPFFPAIYRWRGLFYDPTKRDLTPDVVLSMVTQDDGQTGPGETWQLFEQDPEKAHNLAEPYELRLWDVCRERLEAGESLAAYLVTQVISPEDREVVLEVAGPEDVALYLNGVAVELEQRQVDPSVPPLFREPRRSQALRLTRGVNVLMVHAAAPEVPWGHWFLRAGLCGPNGGPMRDLVMA
ncbi:MAG: TIM-barrel domain-containing protein [Anaerolineae bacterium]